MSESLAASDSAAASRRHAPASEVAEPMRKRASTRLYILPATYRPRGSRSVGGHR
jgi:hypothetical protein